MSSTLSIPSNYKRVVLASRPKASIIPGETFRLETQPSPNLTTHPLQPNQVLFQSYYLSLDPAMRGWLNDARSYIPPVKIGAVMRGATIGRILASTSPDSYPVGSLAVGYSGWTELALLSTLPAKGELEPITLPRGAQITDALGVLGLTGLTAYFGMLRIGDPKPGELVVVSGAAGATGSIAGQIAKIRGARVIGLAGTDEKCTWLTSELGYDLALNYKSPSFESDFRAATKQQRIDVFFDNVGGSILDLCLGRAADHARFVICGGISQYNAAKPEGPRNFLSVISARIRVEGFIVMDYEKEYAEARRELGRWVEEGRLKRQETVLRGGLGVAEEGLVGLYQGLNTGKLLVEVRRPELEVGGGREAKL